MHGLVDESFAEVVESSVSATVRATVSAVAGLMSEKTPEVTVTAVGRALKVDKSTASRRVNTAIAGGFLRNLELRDGRAARLVLGDTIPENTAVLPAPAELQDRCAVAGVAGEKQKSPDEVEWTY